MSSDRPATRLATRLVFLVAGFGVACWAPLVPFAKQRVGLDDGGMGLLLLCVGIGSVAAMQFTGSFSARHGAKPAIVAGALGITAILPLLAVLTSPVAMAAALLAFGAALGSLDVAMNIHAVEVERAAERPMMSGFHAHFSLGGLAGSAAMTALLSLRVPPLPSVACCAAAMLGVTLLARPRLLAGAPGEAGPLLAVPRGIVLLIAGLTGVVFLAEGAILDWSALLVTGSKVVPAAAGGFGYVCFAIAMTVGRFTGDAVTARIGDVAALFWSGVVAVAGFVVQLSASGVALAAAGFLLIGFGASNTVPVLFRRAGTQTVMPPALAISAATTVGYAGILAGPAAIGFAARAVGLPGAFWLVAALVALVPLTARAFAEARVGAHQAGP